MCRTRPLQTLLYTVVMTDIAALKKPLLLCIDDEVDNLDALERLFRKKFQVLKALTPQEGFNHLDQNPNISVIISDQRMPQITGVEFLEKSIDSHPDTIRLLLTGYTDIESVIESINKGQIYRYLTKPWDPVDLQNTVEKAHEKFLLKQELNEKNKALEKALNELQTLDQAKSQFMILINHELKTPLTTILSFAGLLKETILTEEQNLFADRINKSAEKLKSIIDDSLLIVKSEVGLLHSKIEKTSIESLFLEIPSDIGLSIKNKQQLLNFNFEDKFLNADAHLLKMALMRALHNATKFGKAQSTIKIVSKKTNTHFLIQIENSGPAISEAVIEKITKPFQLDENVMNHSVGMGLGLSVCQALIRTMKGQFLIRNSESGVITEFLLPDMAQK